jgi:8-oxo-dGTP diphosphatase
VRRFPFSTAGAGPAARRLVDVTELINVVGGAVVDSLADPQSLLVARRTAPPQFAGMWEFPGGKVDPGEAPEDALHRELREELGVEVRLGPELPAEAAAGWPLTPSAAMRVWFAELAAGTPQPLEDHDELRWVPLSNPAEVLGLPWIPADLPIVEALLAAVAAQPSPK